MSHAGRPTLPFVLPVYEQMRKALQVHVDNEALNPTLRNAVAAGLLKLHEYYSYAKSSHYTMVATGNACCSIKLDNPLILYIT